MIRFRSPMTDDMFDGMSVSDEITLTTVTITDT